MDLPHPEHCFFWSFGRFGLNGLTGAASNGLTAATSDGVFSKGDLNWVAALTVVSRAMRRVVRSSSVCSVAISANTLA